MGHVIEDPQEWQKWFGRQVLASAMDLDPSKWRKPKEIEPNLIAPRARFFYEAFKDYDWTKMLV